MIRHSFDRLSVQLVGTLAVREYLEPVFTARDKEVLLGLLFDDQLRVLKVVSFAGTSDEVQCSIKDILKEAVILEASALILAHNHPTGEISPSRADQQLTREISMCCEHIGITFIDHLIFGEGTYYSFRERGVLPQYR